MIGRLIITTDREEAKKIIRAILIVSQCETDGKLENGTETAAEKANKYLTALITQEKSSNLDKKDLGNEVEENIYANDEDDSEDDGDDDDKDDNDNDNDNSDKRDENVKSKRKKNFNRWLKWRDKTNTEVKILIETEVGDRINALFNSAVARKLMKDLPDLSLWSCVVRDDFGFGRIPASSACVESDFNVIKNSFLKNEVTPMRADEYLQKYLNFLNGKLKIVSARIDCDNSEESSEDVDLANKDDETLDNLETSPNADVNMCPACRRDKTPSGNHKCFICHKPVHNLDSCSTPLDLEEGFGQRRIGLSCKKQDNIEIVISSRHKENWGGETAKASYAAKKKVIEMNNNSKIKHKM